MEMEADYKVKQKFRIQIHRLSAKYIAIGLFLVGFIIGIVVANVFLTSYQEQMKQLEGGTFQAISENEINFSRLLLYTIGQRLKEFMIFWLLCITILGIPYMIYKMVHAGYLVGFFLSVLAIQYGLKGLLLSMAYIFPHYIIYIPIALICLKKGYLLNTQMNQNYHGNMRETFRFIRSRAGSVFLLMLLLCIGCILETYIGAPLLKKAIAYCIS